MFENRFTEDHGPASATVAAPSPNGANGAARGAGRQACQPSPNGSDGAATAPRPDAALPGGDTGASSPGRAANGRFAKGNRGGPGNPFGRQVAALRQALLDALTPADIQAIAAKLIEQAKAGDVASAKLLLQYAIGKPQPAPNPDQQDLEEWQGFQREAGMMAEVEQMVTMPAPELPLKIIRTARPDVTAALSQSLANLAAVSPEIGREYLDRARGEPKPTRYKMEAKLHKPLDVAAEVAKLRARESRRERRARLRQERAKNRKARRPGATVTQRR